MTATNRTDRRGLAPDSLSIGGDVEQRGDARGVVHRAVVDRVAVDRLADAEVVEVGGEDDVFVLEHRVGARQDGRRRSASSTSARVTATVALSRRRDGEVGQRLAGVGRVEDLGEGVARAGEAACRRWAGLTATATFRPRVSSIAGSARVIDGQEPGEAATRAQGMSMFFGFWIVTAPTAPSLAERPTRSPADCMWAASGPGIDGGAPREVDDELASDVQALEVVVTGLGDRQAVAGEDERRPRPTGRGRPGAR